MITLNLPLPHSPYPIHIGQGILENIDLLLPHLPQHKAVIISNTTVGPLYLERLQTALQQHNIETFSILLPDGEQYKSWSTLNQIFDGLLERHCERKTTLIALGGGVVGDITGFAAACYQRGVPFIQIPTTLLAQVDSSIGGKTAINHPLGKNMIGAFYQPKVVIADMQVLATLPDRELYAGIAEIIKYGLLGDITFLAWLENNIPNLCRRDYQALAYAVQRSCEIKAQIVTEDEREQGKRALLNLGHTFGHAIETGAGYGVYLHGEAVALGMILAAELSATMGWIDNVSVKRVISLIQAANLPTTIPHMPVTTWLDLMSHDKKVEGGTMRFVLLKALGQAVIGQQVPSHLLHNLLSR